MTRNSLLRSIPTLLFIFLLNSNLLSAETLHVNEDKSRLEIVNGVAELRLEVMNQSGENLKTHIELSFLVPSGAVARSVDRDETLKPGRNVVQVRVPQLTQGLTLRAGETLPWFRLRYRLSLGSGEEIRGIASLSRLMPETFRLQMGLLRNPARGEPWVIHVLSQNPAGIRPVEGVALTAELRIVPEGDGPDRVETFSGRTDARGVFTFRFPIPKDLAPSEIEVTVKGRRGNEVRVVEGSASLRGRKEILVSTDKPIYQPGQSLKVRALAFADSGNALRSRPLQFRVEDPDGAIVFQADVTSSRFGEAHTDWTIADNARLGPYSVYVEDKDDDRGSGYASIEVRRYDLPNFSVSVKPDRTFYLTGQNASVEIQTDYLFGQHVSKAKIRVIPDDPEEESTPKNVAEGEADADGRFAAAIDLQGRLEELGKYDRQYRDARFKAYATDPSTGRTESRAFVLRLSRNAINVYVGMPHALATGLPVGIFIVTQYPDGRPAECEVQVSPASKEGAPENANIRTVRTNRFGVAFLEESAWKTVRDDETERRALLLEVSAKDAAGHSVTHNERLFLEEDATWVTTDKVVYSNGDPIKIRIQSTHSSGLVVIDLMRDDLLLNSKIIELHDGVGDVTVQSNESYQGRVEVSARFASDPDSEWEGEAHAVSFPAESKLELELVSGQNRHVPGSDATLSFHVQSPRKYSSEAVLGVSIVDRAVDERNRTDYAAGASFAESVEDIESMALAELAKVDRASSLPEDLRLAVEYLLNPYTGRSRIRAFSNSDESTPKYVFQNLIDQSVLPMKTALDARFKEDQTYASDEAGLKTILSAAGWNPDEFRDPWGSTFRFDFEFQGSHSLLNAWSAGPDKVLRTADDFDAFRWGWLYFQKRGELFIQAALKYQGATGQPVRDLTSLRTALLQSGEDLDRWLDPWGRAFQFGFVFGGPNVSITVTTAGADGVFATKGTYSKDDATIFNTSFEYVGLPRRLAQEAVNRFYADHGTYPQTEAQLTQALKAADVSEADMSDPWGHRFYAVIGQVFEYRDSFVRQFIGDTLTYAEFLELERNTLRVIPVTQQIQMITYRSAGPDGIEGNLDDFDAFRLSRLVAQQSALDPAPRIAVDSPPLDQKEGAIQGLVQDSTAAIIPGVTVRLLRDGMEMLQTLTMEDGRYTFARLSPGYYDVRFQLTGFRPLTIRDVPVQNRATALDSILILGESGASVDVSVSAASAGLSFSGLAQIDAAMPPKKALNLKSAEGATPFSTMPFQTSTPRLRQYFPETLVWHPSLEVDRKGNAELHFKLADNITQWRIQATASTMDGRFATASADIVSWQPFFVEHDPPKFLTVGDAIALPVVMRSYLDREQSLNVSMKPETWFEIAGTPQRTSRIDSGAIARETFRFTARTPINDGKQRVTAVGSEVSDAIEKTVTVRPDGREVVQTQSRILQGSTVLDVNLPANSLRDSARAELKIYPDLMSQFTDAMEGIMRRPYGCAEQQISSAYPGLLLLQHQKSLGGVSSSIAAKAKKNLFEAYVNLLSLQSDGGGFTYWGSGAADIAVTAYAVEFLQKSSRFIPVDERVLNRAIAWLASQQRQDGSWSRMEASSVINRADTLTLTGYVARVLSDPDMRKHLRQSTEEAKTPVRDTLQDALEFLGANAEQWGEPASLASVALTALNAGDRETAIRVLGMIERSAHAEGDTRFWDLQTNTLFFGWGLPGRVESTALSVRALAAGREAGIRGENTSAMIQQGMMFLLRNKDRYGVWHSTQSTIRVLETMEQLTVAATPKAGSNRRVDIWIDGLKLSTAFDEAAFKTGSVLTLDISKYLKTGTTRVELRDGGSGATVQLVETHYVPWEGDSVTSEPGLRLNVAFDRTSGKADEEITATVNATRVGFRGYGMMLAEIGLPPGVDVDRASLEKAVANSGSTLFRYDVLPDRIVAYLWPKAGGSQFQFKFRARFGMDAQTPPSILYDYYNPEAQTVLRPVRFHME